MDINRDELCQICGQRKATIIVSTNVNGVKSEQHLCAHCANRLNEGEDFMSEFFNSVNMFSSLMGASPYRKTARVCSKCGTTERDVRKNFRLGCSECYDTFADIVEQMYKQMRGKPYHGRTPNDTVVESAREAIRGAEDAKAKAKIRPVDEATALQEQINEAVRQENYALAAQLKDKLDSLKKQ